MHNVASLIARKFRSILRLPLFSFAWFPVVWLGLGIARASILALSFKRLSPILGRKSDRLDIETAPTEQHLRRAVQIRKAVAMGARNSPWVANCFPQAIVARILFGLYGIPYCLFFGMRRDAETGDLSAHAWTLIGDECVTGRMDGEAFTPVGCYTNQKSEE